VGRPGAARLEHHRPGTDRVALLSDWFPATTGEIVHVDGGVHAVGA
jgi:enoyl-[acyl-carrier-protein] reductase (NADH)